MQRSIFSARYIAPVAGPVLESAVVECLDGRIVSIGPRNGRPIDHDFGDAIILPGLVNAHTHLDLCGALEKTPPCLPFPDWLRQVVNYRRERANTDVANDIRRGLAKLLDSGTTLVGDISVGGESWAACAESALKSVVFFELIGTSQARCEQALADLRKWLEDHAATPRLRPGASPHAPYSFRFTGLAQVALLSVPIAIHLAESFEELELIVERTGEFVDFLQELGVFDPTALPDTGSIAKPLEHAERLLLIHCNYLPADAPIPVNASVVFCPRTHDAFDHPPHPFREWISRGINVALGTDSLASNPDLSVLNEARFLHRTHTGLEPGLLLRMMTKNGAIALGFDDQCGTIEPGKAADFCMISLACSDSADPLRAIMDQDRPVIATICDGRLIRQDHAAQPM